MELASPKFIADSWNGIPDNLDAVLGLGDSGKPWFWPESLTSSLICLLWNLLETLISCGPRAGAKFPLSFANYQFHELFVSPYFPINYQFINTLLMNETFREYDLSRIFLSKQIIIIVLLTPLSMKVICFYSSICFLDAERSAKLNKAGNSFY